MSTHTKPGVMVTTTYSLFTDEITAVTAALVGTWTIGEERVTISLPMANFLAADAIEALVGFRDPSGRRPPRTHEA